MSAKKLAPNKLELQLFKQYNRNCRRRNVFFGLTIAQFCRVIYLPCAYCDKPPSQMIPGYGRYNPFTGIDRVNPKWGYTIENVKPCCPDCNAMKSNRLTPAEARVVGLALAQYRQANAKPRRESRLKSRPRSKDEPQTS